MTSSKCDDLEPALNDLARRHTHSPYSVDLNPLPGTMRNPSPLFPKLSVLSKTAFLLAFLQDCSLPLLLWTADSSYLNPALLRSGATVHGDGGLHEERVDSGVTETWQD